jgi:Short-chain dehydrogenases of various substrate specificities
MTTRWTVDDIPDQTGRVAVVTGGNSGLGLETCRALAGAGATVVLACRRPDAGEAAAEDVRRTHPDARIEVQRLDLGSLGQIADAAEAIRGRHTRVDLLINNAGIMATPQAPPRTAWSSSSASTTSGTSR